MSTSTKVCSAAAVVAVAFLLQLFLASDQRMHPRSLAGPSDLELLPATELRENTESSAETPEAAGIPDEVLRTPFRSAGAASKMVIYVQYASSGDPVVGASLTVNSYQSHKEEAPISTDENGIAVVQVRCLDSTHPILTARYGGLFGELWSDSKPTNGIYTLYLHPDAVVRVHVSHIDGAPAPDAPVELQVRTWPLERPSLETLTIIRQRTDSLGIATFVHVNARVRRHSAGTEMGASFVALLPGLGVSSKLLSLNVEEHQLKLIRPSTSSVSLQIKGGDPKYLLGAVCRVSPVGGPEGDQSTAAEVPIRPDGTMLPDLLPDVSYSVELSHWNRIMGRMEFVAPQPGRSTEIALPLENWRAVSASLMDEDGAAIIDERVTLFTNHGSEVAVYYCKTDGAGRVAVSVDASASKGLAYKWVIASVWPDPRSGMRSANFVLGDDGEKAEGFPQTKVSHEGVSVLAQGRILDDRGRALAPSVMSALRCDGGSGVLDVSFVPLSGESEPGEFCVLGNIVDSAFVIRAVGPGWMEEVTCFKGTNNVRIVHVRESHLTAFIEGDAAASLRVVLRKCIGQGDASDSGSPQASVARGLSHPSTAPGERMRREPSRVRRVRGGCEFYWQSLDEGVYDLEVQSLGSRDACLVMPAVVVKPGDCTDPRLKRIFLGSAVRVVNVLLMQQDGSRLKESSPAVALVATELAEGMVQSVPVVVKDSRISFFADPGASQITLCIDGFQPVVVPHGASDLAVDLTPQ